MNEVGHGRSNTVPRQSMLKISDTVIQAPSEAHHAQSSSSAQVVHSGYSPHLGVSARGDAKYRTGRRPIMFTIHPGGGRGTESTQFQRHGAVRVER